MKKEDFYFITRMKRNDWLTDMTLQATCVNLKWVFERRDLISDIEMLSWNLFTLSGFVLFCDIHFLDLLKCIVNLSISLNKCHYYCICWVEVIVHWDIHSLRCFVTIDFIDCVSLFRLIGKFRVVSTINHNSFKSIQIQLFN